MVLDSTNLDIQAKHNLIDLSSASLDNEPWKEYSNLTKAVKLKTEYIQLSLLS